MSRVRKVERVWQPSRRDFLLSEGTRRLRSRDSFQRFEAHELLGDGSRYSVLNPYAVRQRLAGVAEPYRLTARELSKPTYGYQDAEDGADAAFRALGYL